METLIEVDWDIFYLRISIFLLTFTRLRYGRDIGIMRLVHLKQL